MYDPWQDRLSEHIDGTLAPDEATRLGEHLRECAGCRAVVAELEQVRALAADLPEVAPAADLWPGIAARIAASPAPGVVRLADRRPLRWHVSLSLPQLAAAAAAVMVLSGGGMWLALARGGAPQSPVSVVEPQPVTSPVRLVSDEGDGYEAAIAELQRSLLQTASPLDSSTVVVLRQSLAAIDQAIADARSALAQDPSNQFLHRHLDGAMKKKVDILRRAVSVRRAAS